VSPRARGAAAAPPPRPPLGTPSPSFEFKLAGETRRRHERIARTLPGAAHPPIKPMPRGYRAEDYTGEAELEGFLPSWLAAEEQGVDEGELVRQARRGLLECKHVGSVLYVRPAIVTVLGVRDHR